MTETEMPSYYGIIPAEVRYDKELTANAKLLYSELTCLSQKEGYCFSSNSYFADLYGVTTQAISKWINQLADKGYVKLEYIYNGKEVKERRIYLMGVSINIGGVSTNNEGGINKRLKGYQQKVKDNNTSINNINNNINTKKKNPKSELFERVDEYTENEELRIVLKKYLQFKLKSSRSFNIDQWNIQLGNLRKFSGGNVIAEISKVNKSYANGYQALVYENELNKNTNFQRRSAYDVACNHIDSQHDYSKDAGEVLENGELGF